MIYNENDIKQAKLNLKHRAPIVKEYNGYIVLAHTIDDFNIKCNHILMGRKDGFFTIERALNYNP